MNKLWLIIKREYLSRVRKRAFILGTFLTPFAFALFFVVVGLIFSYEGNESLTVAVVDTNQVLNAPPADTKHMVFKMEEGDFDALAERLEETAYDVIVKVPSVPNIKAKNFTVYYYSKEQLGLDMQGEIQDGIGDKIRTYKMKKLDLSEEQLASLRSKVSLINAGDKEDNSFSSVIGALLGGAMGVIMYISVFVYGVMVMRSVMEEKTNRIVEVMISSVRPFQLMMGKIIGVGLVGLTQLSIWMILIPLFYLLAGLFFNFDPEQMNSMASAGAEIDPEQAQSMVAQVMIEIGNQNWWLIVPSFILYFLGGYFLYSSLFAAVGSAMGDDYGEGQALMFPITIPVILAFYIMMVVLRMPQSGLAVWSSMFPLFSPIVMPARLAFSPPLWQVGLSMVILIASSIFFVWLSARIYRVGIFMYGKKVTLREIGKWMFYKQ